MQQKMHAKKSVKPGRNIIQHDAGARRQPFQPPYRRRLNDIETTEEYKTRKESFPRQRGRNQRDELARNLIDHDRLRILHAGSACNLRCRRHAHQRNQCCQRDRHRDTQRCTKRMSQRSPENHGRSRRPTPRPRPQPTHAEKSGNECSPERTAWAGCPRDSWRDASATVGKTRRRNF
jgi:hypothetical protein